MEETVNVPPHIGVHQLVHHPQGIHYIHWSVQEEEKKMKKKIFFNFYINGVRLGLRRITDLAGYPANNFAGYGDNLIDFRSVFLPNEWIFLKKKRTNKIFN